jgi:hypothetical protein
MRTILIAAVVLLIAQVTFSQDLVAARQRATEKTAQMKNDLSLTQTQEPQVLALNIELEEEIEKINSDIALAKSDKTAQLDAVEKKEKERLKTILSTEQFDVYYSGSEPSKAKIHTSRSSIKKN